MGGRSLPAWERTPRARRRNERATEEAGSKEGRGLIDGVQEGQGPSLSKSSRGSRGRIEVNLSTRNFAAENRCHKPSYNITHILGFIPSPPSPLSHPSHSSHSSQPSTPIHGQTMTRSTGNRYMAAFTSRTHRTTSKALWALVMFEV